jgi:hypothetical protein
MNKHSENNRARRICAKLRTILHALKSHDEQIAAIQFNEELSTEEKDVAIRGIQNQSKIFAAKKNTLEKRAKELAYEDTNPVAAAARGTGFSMLTHTEVIPERASDSARRTRISRRQCKCTRSFFSVIDCYAH